MTQSKVPGPNLGSVTVTGTVVEKQDQTAIVQTTWTSATGLNTTTATYACTGYGTANVGITVPTTCTAGAVTVEVSQDGGTTWVPAPALRQDNGLWEVPVQLAFFPGTNGSRIYAVSVDAFTHLRAKLTTVIAGAGNTVVSITAVAGGIEPFVTVRPRQVAAYGAGYRLAVASASATTLLFTPVVNTDKQLATIYHTTASTKTVRVRYVSVLLSIANANAYEFELRRLSATTAPATGNPAIVPGAYDSADAAAEATCLALPTTAGSETAADRALTPGFTVNTAAGVAPANVLGVAGQELVLYNARALDERKPLTLRAGVAEGFAVVGRGNQTNAVAFKAYIEFTEEAP